jgi:chromosome segregation ATPase
MNLAIRDHKIHQLKAELENRKRILCAKRHQLKSSTKENELLKEVLYDYENYNKQFIEEKEKQIVFLKTLNQYIENVTSELKLTDNKLKESKMDQREILKEISFLKNELDELMNNNSDKNSNTIIDE